MDYPAPVTRLIDELRKLPGIGPKSAQRIAFHLEACPEPGPVLERIREAGVSPGLVVLPDTPVAQLERWIGQVDFVNPLGVNPVAKTGYDE